MKDITRLQYSSRKQFLKNYGISVVKKQKIRRTIIFSLVIAICGDILYLLL